MDFNKIKLDRRAALKAAGAGLAAATVGGCSSAPEKKAPAGIVDANGKRVLPWSNWSGNQSCQPSQRVVPRNEDQIVDFVKKTDKTIRCVGAGHSFSSLVPTNETMMSLARLRGVESIDKATKEATIWSGTRLAQIGDPLWKEGLGLINMPDINTQALAGAIATSTHGTGATMGSMSSDVTEMRTVLANGDILTTNAKENSDVFNAMRTSMGALGVVTKMKMQTRDKYNLREDSWMMDLNEGFEQMESLRDNNRHFEMYALPHADYILAITLNEHEGELPPPQEASGDAYETFRTLAKVIDYVPFMRSFIVNTGASTVKPEHRTGRSHDIFGNLRDMRFNEMEYSVPAEYGPQCLKEILDMIKKENLDIIFPIEYRYIKADDIWLSPFYKRDSAAISCHNFHDRDYKKYFALCEKIFQKYDGRPHWGKVNSLGPKEFAARYDRWDDFQKVRNELDPQGKFLNSYLKTAFGIA